ncbi:MAG TPA: glycosyltransferase [Candidatus Sulfotelmatobacter sp.]|jgi:glycosyltransferase involved in cell wall biosynthesis|nr:glycosyltransferase [Candidatus Sulfotelmatobacter sp.]
MNKNNNKNLPTISIGTSALNEENMIGNFLQSLLNQEQLSYHLDKIIINSDGSSDNTTKIAKSFKNKHLLVIDHKIRKGRTNRIMEIFKINTSDILVIIDTDMLLGSPRALENLVHAFNSKKTLIAGLNVQPINSKTFVGRLLYTWEKMWLEIRMRIRNGDTILSLRGGAFAIRNDLVKQITIPQTIHQIAEYLYHSVKNKNKSGSFKFIVNALVYYRQPETLADYISSLSRGDKQDIVTFTNIFGRSILQEYIIPRKQKYQGLFKTFLRYPLSLCLTLCFVQFARIVSKNKNNLDKHGFWPVTYSTKKAFTLKDI